MGRFPRIRLDPPPSVEELALIALEAKEAAGTWQVGLASQVGLGSWAFQSWTGGDRRLAAAVGLR
jgi:hypothetical protein